MKLSTLATRSARHRGGRSASGDHHRGVAKDADEGRIAARMSREHPAAADKQSDAHKANEISRLVRVLRDHFPAHDFQLLAANSHRPRLRR
jgi:hypothetical protein